MCWQVTNFMVTFDPKIKWRPLLCMSTMLVLYDKSLRNASSTSKHFMVEQHVSITKKMRPRPPLVFDHHHLLNFYFYFDASSIKNKAPKSTPSLSKI